MKYVCATICFLVLLSCGTPPAPPPPAAQIVLKDSNIIQKAASNPYEEVDASPMDMAYFPADYPVAKMNGLPMAQPRARVIYSRPHRGGRKLFGGLVQWGQPWRLGANEATEIQFFQPVTIQNKRVEKGVYVMYAIPFEDHWTIILNSNVYAWGLKFNTDYNTATFDVPAITKAQLIEYFTMVFERTSTGADLVMAWESMEVRLPVQF